MKYDVWTTNDGRAVKVNEMTDCHIINTYRAMAENRIGFFLDYNNEQRNNWLAVFKGEALKRDLDLTKPPFRKLGLVEHLFDVLSKVNKDAKHLREMAKTYMENTGIIEPQIDVSNLDDLPTYMHWVAEKYPDTLGTHVERK